jgi:hypothetical protein
MNRTTTVVVALIAAAGLSTMVYAVPEQRALAWGGGFGGFGCGGCGGCGFGFGCGGGFFGDGFHKHIIQTASQVNTCHGNGEDADTGYSTSGPHTVTPTTGGGEKCVNTGVNTSGNVFGGLGSGQGLDGTNH